MSGALNSVTSGELMVSYPDRVPHQTLRDRLKWMRHSWHKSWTEIVLN